MNNRGVGKIIIFVLILIVLVAAIYFTFFFYYKCDDVACFTAHQEKCAKTKFLNSAEYADWKYKINGKKDGKCEINVEIVKVKQGNVDKLTLEGKSMNCILPLGSINPPENDISKCHGELKEEMQNLIIQKLHSYILDNLGEIGAELNSITAVQGNITAGNSTGNNISQNSS